jgi:hypothetical protein
MACKPPPSLDFSDAAIWIELSVPLLPEPQAEVAAIRTAFNQGGEFAAAVELRRLFPGVTDNV